MPYKKAKSLLIKFIPIVFYILFIFFFVLYLKSIDLSKLADVHFDWVYLIIAIIFGLAFRYWGAYIWVVLLRLLGAKDIYLSSTLVYIYAKSWLGRYIPGTAPWILGKIYFASKHGISKNKLAVSSLLEGGLQINVVMVLSALLLMFDYRLNVVSFEMRLIMGVVVVLGAISMTPAVFNRIISIAYKTIRKATIEDEHLANWEIISKGTALYTIGAVISGVSFFFIAKAVFPELSYTNAVFVIGAASLASAASMLAVFAPSGLGVREGIQLVLLSIIMPTEYALLVTVFTRLWSIVTDLLFFGISLTVRKLTKQLLH